MKKAWTPQMRFHGEGLRCLRRNLQSATDKKKGHPSGWPRGKVEEG
jgi:hypothetical protein